MRNETKEDTVFEWERKWYAIPFFRKMKKKFIQLPDGTVLEHSGRYETIVLVGLPDAWAIGFARTSSPPDVNDLVQAEEVREQIIWSDPEDGPW